MNDTIGTIFAFPTMLCALCFVDQLARIDVAQDLAALGAFRAASAVVSRVGTDHEVSADVEEGARVAAALALWPDARAAVGTADVNVTVDAAAARLRDQLGLSFDAPLSAAVANVEVSLYYDNGGWQPLSAGTTLAAGTRVRAVVRWPHPLRSDPPALLLRDTHDGDGSARWVEGEAVVRVGA